MGLRRRIVLAKRFIRDPFYQKQKFVCFEQREVLESGKEKMENRAIEWKAVEWRKMAYENIPLLKRINESLLSPGEIVTLS